MLESITEQKNQIRKHGRQVRLSLGVPLRRKASQDICAHIANWPVFQCAHVILTYLPIKAEVNLCPLLETFPQKRWILPRIMPGIMPEADRSMRFHPYDPLQLVRHPFGMDEPAANLPVVAPEEIHLALTPGLAYDRCGWRLGYGGGYYDRFLAGFSGVSLGVVFEALLLDSLPRGEYDVPVKWIVTEKELTNVSV